MQKADIKIGEEYALREKLGSNEPLQRVKILQHVRGKKWKAEWIDPNPGLVDYVDSKQLLVRWKGLKAYLRDEESARRLQEDNERQGFKNDSTLDKVIYEVFHAIAEKEVNYYRGVLSGPPDALERVKERARLDPSKSSLYAYKDRHGTIHVPFAEALEIAKAFCTVEPGPVLSEIESTEREWAQEASHPGNEYKVDLLNEYRASWAILRQWAGYNAAIAEREAQIQKLERLVWDAIYALQKKGVDDEAHRLRRALQRN